MDMAVETTWNASDSVNVASALSWQARRQPNVTAIHYPKGGKLRKPQYHSCTYQELDELSDCYARGLQAYGIGPGVRTALMVTPGLDFFALFFALFKAGAVPVLIDPGIGVKPLKQCLEEAEPKAFIGVTKAHLARKILGWAKKSCKLLVTAGPGLGLGGITLKKLKELGDLSSEEAMHPSKPEDIAAILFTSGSTGVPKGVIYRHRHFNAQVEMLRTAFDIQPGEVSLPTFPPFALFDPALGMTTVVPLMDPTRPAEADPVK
ncbi:MAG: AMP-binding protein, partial [Xanthomonadales bacterium]|nr:AMP-binding protein [Xanthomonadales bacterium]